MIQRSLLLVAAFIFVVVYGCSSGIMPGRGGKSYARRIEKTGHPNFPDGVSCYVCHKDEKPNNEFHSKFGRDCSQCHVKTTWMASKYPHTKWPLHEKHNTRCTFCHIQLSSFDFSYQCWGCHHKSEATRKDHTVRGKNITDKCVTCHKLVVIKKNQI